MSLSLLMCVPPGKSSDGYKPMVSTTLLSCCLASAFVFYYEFFILYGVILIKLSFPFLSRLEEATKPTMLALTVSLLWTAALAYVPPAPHKHFHIRHNCVHTFRVPNRDDEKR